MMLKTFLRSSLRRRGYHIAFVMPGLPTGLALDIDLPIVLNTHSPHIFDVGANIGQSVELFRRVYPECTIRCFEPSPAAFGRLQKQYGQFRGVELNCLALGAKVVDRVKFNEYAHSTLNSMLELNVGPENPFADIASTSSTIDVEIRTVDNVRAAGEYIDLLKIDTQGFDLEVLRGAGVSLGEGAVGAVLVELNFLTMYANQAESGKIISFLSDFNFRLVDLYEKVRRDRALGWCTALFSRVPT